MRREIFDLVLESNFNAVKASILEEAGNGEIAQRNLHIIAEAASALDKVKEFVKNNKGKLAAGAALAAAAGAGYYAHEKGMLGGVEDKAANLADKAGLNNVADKLKTDANTQDLKGAVEGNKAAEQRLIDKYGIDAAKAAEYSKALEAGKIPQGTSFDQYKHMSAENASPISKIK